MTLPEIIAAIVVGSHDGFPISVPYGILEQAGIKHDTKDFADWLTANDLRLVTRRGECCVIRAQFLDAAKKWKDGERGD